MTMTFDLLDWIPVQMVNPNDVGLPTIFAAVVCVAAPIVLFKMTAPDGESEQRSWLHRHRIPLCILVAILACVTAIDPVTRIVKACTTPDIRQTTTLGEYIDRQVQTYTPRLADVQCETPVPDDKYTFLEQEGRYPCTWRFDGKPITGSVRIAYSRSGLFTYPKATATLLDAHGDAWCPADWKTQYGCEPILADGNRAAAPTTPEEVR